MDSAQALLPLVLGSWLTSSKLNRPLSISSVVLSSRRIAANRASTFKACIFHSFPNILVSCRGPTIRDWTPEDGGEPTVNKPSQFQWEHHHDMPPRNSYVQTTCTCRVTVQKAYLHFILKSARQASNSAFLLKAFRPQFRNFETK